MFNHCARDGDTSTIEDTNRAIRIANAKADYAQFFSTLADRPAPPIDPDAEIPFQHKDDPKMYHLPV